MADPSLPTTDPLDTPLPCDVDLGGMVIRQGVPLRVLVDAARRWRAEIRSAINLSQPMDKAAFERAIYDIMNGDGVHE